MIYLKRILWLLGYPIMWVLASIVLWTTFVFSLFEYLFLYIKNGNIKGCFNIIEKTFKIVEWYNDIEPKED